MNGKGREESREGRRDEERRARHFWARGCGKAERWACGQKEDAASSVAHFSCGGRHFVPTSASSHGALFSQIFRGLLDFLGIIHGLSRVLVLLEGAFRRGRAVHGGGRYVHVY